MSLLTLTQSTFDEALLASGIPVLVDVWAPWCGPCFALKPVLEELARDLDGRLRIVEVNADDDPFIVARYDVMAFPTLLVFSEGQLVKRMVGARGRRHLLEELSTVVSR
jgi:thioredoxin